MNFLDISEISSKTQKGARNIENVENVVANGNVSTSAVAEGENGSRE